MNRFDWAGYGAGKTGVLMEDGEATGEDVVVK